MDSCARATLRDGTKLDGTHWLVLRFSGRAGNYRNLFISRDATLPEVALGTGMTSGVAEHAIPTLVNFLGNGNDLARIPWLFTASTLPVNF